MARTETEQFKLGGINIRILEMLRHNSRASLATIGRKTEISKPAVKYRIDRLLETDIIKNLFTLVDSRTYGITLSVVLNLTVELQMIQVVAAKPGGYPEVVRVYELSNSPQLHVHVLFTDNDKMERFLRSKLYSLRG